MLKNMIESMISAVQDRFKDYDKTIANLKHKIELLEQQRQTKSDQYSSNVLQKFEKEKTRGKLKKQNHKQHNKYMMQNEMHEMLVKMHEMQD